MLGSRQAGRGLSHRTNETIHHSFVCLDAPSHEQLMCCRHFSPLLRPPLSYPPSLCLTFRGCQRSPLPSTVTLSQFINFVFSGWRLFFFFFSLDSHGASAHKTFWFSLCALPVSLLTGFSVLLVMHSRHFSDTPDNLVSCVSRRERFKRRIKSFTQLSKVDLRHDQGRSDASRGTFF